MKDLLAYDEICKCEPFRRFICHPKIIKILYRDSESPTKKSIINTKNNTDDTVDVLFERKRNSFSSDRSSVFAHSPESPAVHHIDYEDHAEQSQTELLIDFFIEIFELRGLRRQAIVTILQHFFGDTVEKRVVEMLDETLTKEKATELLQMIITKYWPNGKFVPDTTVRTEDQKQRSKFEASDILSLAFPELIGGIVGRQNARRGAMKSCQLFQNTRLNQHLMYKLLDEILNALFPKN